MPWAGKSDVGRHNKKAAGSKEGIRVWSEVANKTLASGKSDASAIRIANSVINKLGRAPKGK
jgi:hypothetical protein